MTLSYTPAWPTCPVCNVTTPEHTPEQCERWAKERFAAALKEAIAEALRSGVPHETIP